MATDSTKFNVGAALLVVCGAAMVAIGVLDLPLLVGSVAILGMAAGSLLVGTSGDKGRPV
jgi:hypothetical protein